MSQLNKQEITAFLGILLKKNPIVDIEIDENRLIITHFNGKSDTIRIEEDEIVFPEFPDFSDQFEQIDQVHQQYDIKLNLIEQKLTEYINQPDNTLTKDDVDRLIENYCEKLTPTNITNITETVEFDQDQITNIIHEQLDLFRSEFKLPEISPQVIPDFIKPEDLISFKREIANEYRKLKQELEANITSVANSFPSIPQIDYTHINSLIDTKIENITSNFISKSIGDKIVTGIEPVRGVLSICYSDGSSVDFVSLITPIVRTIVQPLLNSQTSRAVGAGGYGGGSPGLSAYEIALKNGFIGTELEWLASLSGNGSSIVYPGTITYDANNNISTIVSGPSTTIINRDSSGKILSIHKNNYTKTLIRDSFNKIVGWDIVYD